MTNQNKGLTRIIKAGGYSCKGIRAAWINEAAFRQEVIVTLVAIILSFFIDVSGLERILLVGSVVLVVILELVNSAIEAVVDRIDLNTTNYQDVQKIWVLPPFLLLLYWDYLFG